MIKEHEGKTYIRLSNSALSDWDDCPKKCYYRRIVGLVPRERIAVFDIGTLGHVGCAAFLHPTNQQFDPQTRYKMARNSIQTHFDEKLKPLGVSPDTLNEALHTFPVILRRRLPTVPLSVEQWWETTITDPDFPHIVVVFVGKADVLSSLENSLFVEEHKFVSARGFGDNKREEYQKGRQTKGYIVLASDNLKKPVRGVVHNFFLKKKEPDLDQRITYVGPKDIARFKRSVVLTAHEIIEMNKMAQARSPEDQGKFWQECLDGCRGWHGACRYNALCEFDDNPEIRREKYEVHDPQAKFEILDTISKREDVASDLPQQTDGGGPGVEA